MKEIELSEEVYNKLEEYRRRLSEKLGREVSFTELLYSLIVQYEQGGEQ